MQPEPGEAHIDRQWLLNFCAAVIKKVGGIGNGGWYPVSNQVDRDGALVKMAEMEQLQPELTASGAKEGLVGAKPYIAPGIEIQFVERVGESRGRGIESRRGEIAGAAYDVFEIEFWRGLWRLRRLRGRLGGLRWGGQDGRREAGARENEILTIVRRLRLSMGVQNRRFVRNFVRREVHARVTHLLRQRQGGPS